jgi:hypothetical protein
MQQKREGPLFKTSGGAVDFPQWVGPAEGQPQKPHRRTGVDNAAHCDSSSKVDE